MSDNTTKPIYSKIFALIIRIREYEKKSAASFITSLKYKYYLFRDRARIILGLYMGKFTSPKEKETIEFLSSCYRYRHVSNGQLFQDVLAYFVSPKTNGFFVEFGATDGCFLSNTLFLEKQYGWKGILAEPAKSWTNKLKINRGNCAIDYRCVWSKTGEQINFIEDALPEISGVSATLNKSRMSVNSSNYIVDTVSLIDLLEEHRAPKYIDFISIDTEGSEFGILEHFDFSRYQFGLVAVEHNYETEKREKIHSLLTKNHYKRVLQNLSAEDDWYVPSALNKF
jgi:FkbM family methyltransferase